MADFTVPLATNLFGSIDPLIANAKGTDLSWIGNIPDSYWAGQNQQYQQRNRDLFQNGIPSDAGTMADVLIKAAGAAAVPEYQGGEQRRDRRPARGDFWVGRRHNGFALYKVG